MINQVDFQYTFTPKISSSADQNVCPVGGDVDTGVGKVVGGVVGGVLGGVAVSLIVIAVIIAVIIAVSKKVSCLSFQMLKTTSRHRLHTTWDDGKHCNLSQFARALSHVSALSSYA